MHYEQPGVNAFTELSDTPSSYAGAGEDVLTVKVTADGVEFTDASSLVTFYTDAVSGSINGSNTAFTVANTINTPLALFLGNSIYQPTIDFTTSGTDVTMLIAPHGSLAGQPFWLLHT